MALPLLLAGASAIAPIITGAINNRRAKKLRKKGEALMNEAYAKRTDFEIPDEILQNKANAQNEAFGKPALVRQMEEAALREQANNVGAVQRYATSGADALAAITGVNQQAAVGMNQAAIAGEEVRQQNMQALQQANMNVADYKTMAWDMNVNMPFLQRMQFAQDMIGSGMQGQNDAMAQIGSGFQNALMGAGMIAANANIPGGVSMGGVHLGGVVDDVKRLFGPKSERVGYRRRMAGGVPLPSGVTPKSGSELLG